MLNRVVASLARSSKSNYGSQAPNKAKTSVQSQQGPKSTVFKRQFCTKLSEEQTLRKKLKWRAMERGMKENEIIFRSFIAKHLETMPAKLLPDFETLLDEGDPDLYKWLSGSQSPPEDIAGSEIWKMVTEHVKTDLKVQKSL